MFDIERILSSINIIDVAQALGIEVNYNSYRAAPNGDGTEIKCPFHHDTKFGSTAKLIDVTKNGRHFIGMSCWACSERWNAIDMVSKLKGLEFIDSVKFLIELTGRDPSCFEDQVFNPNKKSGFDLPAPLNSEALRLLEFNVKPDQHSQIPKGEVLFASDVPLPGTIRISKLNPDFDENFEPETEPGYPFAKTNFDNDLFVDEYFVVNPVRFSLNDLYREDYLAYMGIISERALALIKEKENLLFNIKGNTKNDVAERFCLKKDIKELKKIGRHVSSLTKSTYNKLLTAQEKSHHF